MRSMLSVWLGEDHHTFTVQQNEPLASLFQQVINAAIGDIKRTLE